jgi:hypothetical protein
MDYFNLDLNLPNLYYNQHGFYPSVAKGEFKVVRVAHLSLILVAMKTDEIRWGHLEALGKYLETQW